MVIPMKAIHRVFNSLIVVFGSLLIAVSVSPVFADDPSRPQGREIADSFQSPVYRGYRLDWCLRWAEGCGQEAADAWCRLKGYQYAVRFEIDEDIGGITPTKIIGTGQMCTEDFCDGFKSIECYKQWCPAGLKERCCYGKEC
jgi:hypothetical protein